MTGSPQLAYRSESSHTARWVLLFLVVVAMIVGVLAMHVFASDMGNHNDSAMSSMPTVVTASVTSENIAQPPTAVAPAATMLELTPAPDLMMSSMICILALFAGLLLAVACSALLRALLTFTNIIRQPISRPATLAGPAPPNLIVLSISRV
jgi:hypothetical protein